MKTTVIPAQITTIEDRIAGNLNLTQILLLLSSLFVATFIYAIFPESMKFTLYKIPLILFVLITFGILSLRIKGKVVLNWLLILAQYNTRPRYYMFNKNNLFLRDVEPLQNLIEKPALAKAKEEAKVAETQIMHPLSFTDLVDIEDFLERNKFSFQFNRKGGINVAVAKIKQ